MQAQLPYFTSTKVERIHAVVQKGMIIFTVKSISKWVREIDYRLQLVVESMNLYRSLPPVYVRLPPLCDTQECKLRWISDVIVS